MKIYSILLIFLATTSGLKAQSIYLDSLQSTFSGTFSYSRSNDFNSFGYGISYTIKGSTNLGLVYITGSEEAEYSEFEGLGFGGYASFNVLNELRQDPLGLEFGFTYQNTEFKEQGREDDIIKTNTFGIGLNFSKRSQSYEDKKPGNFIVQAGLTAFPISESELIDGNYSNGIYTDPFVAGNFAFAILIGNPSSFRFVIEPSVTHNFKHSITAFSFSLTGIF